MGGQLAATCAQVAALIAVISGLYLLIGLAWTLIIGGALIFALSVAVEVLGARARPTVRQPHGKGR